jgi:hypothetical protein
MSDLTKITVVGRSRRVTLVVPADEPLGAHVAEIARLLEQPGARTALTTPYGEQLDLALAPADQDVLDGAVLRLIDVEQLPAPPEVTDVTDRVAELRDEARGAWDTRHVQVAAALGLGVLSAGIGTTLSTLIGGPVAVALLVVVAAAATLAGLLRSTAVSTLLFGAALGATLPVATWLSALLTQLVAPASTSALVSGPAGVATLVAGPAIVVALVVGLSWLVIAAAIGLGRQSPGAALGATVGILLTGTAVIPPLFGVGLAATAGVVAALGVLVLGVLPSLAVSASGLASLDDEVIAGSLPGRDRVATSLRESFRITGWAVVAVAVWVGPAIALLLASGELWTTMLGAVVALVTMLRTRVVPMAVSRWALWIASFGGLAIGIALAPGIPSGIRLVVGIAAAAIVAALALARPSVQSVIRWRRVGDVLETIATAAIVPFLLGAFGVYAYLLAVFA